LPKYLLIAYAMKALDSRITFAKMVKTTIASFQ